MISWLDVAVWLVFLAFVQALLWPDVVRYWRAL